jgi:hypothetical protein
MIPVPWPVVVMYVLTYALAGMGIGAIIWWLVSRPTRGSRSGLLKDAFLGCLGYTGGFIVCAFLPWPQNTLVEQLDGGGSVATTISRYQHPQRVAIALAILFPLLRELYRWRKREAISLT